MLGISLSLWGAALGGGRRPPVGFAFITVVNPATNNRELVTVVNPTNGLREPIAVRIAA